VVLLYVTGLPDPAAYPWLMASVVLGCLYWIALGAAYQTGALAMVFPLSRGTGVLLTTFGATTMMGETLAPVEMLTVAAVLAGLALVAVNGAPGTFTLRGVGPSLVLAVIIAAFVLVDATGARASGSAAAYCAMLYVGNAIGIGMYAMTVHPGRIARLGRTAILPALSGGALSLVAYALILYGMTHAPIAVVAAMAETSIVFAGIIGVVWLREPAPFGHMAGLAMVAFGVFVLRLSQ
jgi:drug/metabolite transporter (DMT)-like permease